MKTGSPFKTVALVGKYHADGVAEPLLTLAACIAQRGHHVVFERDTGAIIPLATHNTADKLIRAYELTRG